MWLIDKILIIFPLLLVNTCVQALEHRNFRKEWKFQGHAIIKYGRVFARHDNSFLYAICNEEKLPTELNCNVTIETPINAWEKSISHKDTCNLKLIGSEDGSVKNEVTAIVSIERFTDNKAIVLWWERQQNSQYEIQNIKVSILNMVNCTTTHLTFPVDVGMHVVLSNVVIYPNTFDVIVSNKAMCGIPTCRISHDVNGQRIGNPSPFISNFADVYTQPVTFSSADKGFYVSGSDMNAWKFRAMHVSPDGIRTSLMTASVSDPRQVQHATSVSHELYGVCIMGEKKIHCAQFDDESNVKMNASMSISGSVQWMAVHNLPESGIFLLTGNCNNNKCRNFKIIRMHPGGRHEKPIDISGFHLKCSNVSSKFFVNVTDDEDYFCFYFACTHEQTEKKGVRSSVKFSSKCIPKSELTVKQ